MRNFDSLERLLASLMSRYRARVPDVDRIVAAMIEEGAIQRAADIENDHIAFRTLGVPNLGIAALESVFLHHGYERRDAFQFEAKKLNAFWYHPPRPEYPRIFISELRVGDLSRAAQTIVHSYTDLVTQNPTIGLDLDDPVATDAFLHQALWPLPSWSDYTALLAESEYAAWTIYNRCYLNHFTVSIHNLPEGWSSIEAYCAFLERRGFKLNDSGGKIKVSADGKLLQASTVAEVFEAEFANGEQHRIAGSYVEFAERKPLDQFVGLAKSDLRREHRREGFEANNADRIFESTYLSQIERDMATSQSLD